MGSVRADAVRLEQLLRVAVVGSDEADAAGGVRCLDDDTEAFVRDLDRGRHSGDRARVADHVRVGEVDHRPWRARSARQRIWPGRSGARPACRNRCRSDPRARSRVARRRVLT